MLARPDTRVLVTGPITQDSSHYATDLTASGAGAYEDPSPRTALSGAGNGRAIELEVDIAVVDAGVLVAHGYDTGANTYKIEVVAGGDVTFAVNGTDVATVAPPGIAEEEQTFIVAWSTEPNPATTGPADELRSVALVYSIAGDALACEVVAHANDPADPAGAFSIGGAWDGLALTIPYSRAISAARASARYHTRVEVREHWVAQTPAPVLEGILAVEGPVVPEQAAEVPALVGPAYQAAAARMATGRNRHRNVSALAQWQVRSPPSYENELRDTVPGSWVLDLGDGYQTHVGWLCRRRVPRACSFVGVRIQLATWPSNLDPLDLTEIRIHAANAKPTEQTEQSVQLVDRDVDDGVNGVGVQIEFGPLFVVRDDDGYTYFYLSARTDGGSGAGNAVYSIRELSIVPIATAAGLQAQPPNAWGP